MLSDIESLQIVRTSFIELYGRQEHLFESARHCGEGKFWIKLKNQESHISGCFHTKNVLAPLTYNNMWYVTKGFGYV